jgi:hypothetical protein
VKIERHPAAARISGPYRLNAELCTTRIMKEISPMAYELAPLPYD